LRKVMQASERASSPGSGMPYRWAPERQARIGVMPRDGSADDIRWFEVAPCYVFHPLNSYDVAAPDGDSIVLDVVRHESVFTNGDSLFPETRSLDRWTVDLTAGKVTEERIDDTIQEFPRVDERLVGRPHRFGYAVGYSPAATGTADAILKHDLTTRRTQSRAFGPHHEPGEFVFVPSSDDAAEDDGVAMGFVYDRSTDRSDLVLLDGATMETVGTVHLPVRVPHGFHGNWVPS
jgi:carotenoid cleavage oxygenase